MIDGGDVPAFQFDGTPADLIAAMEKSFVVSKRKKKTKTAAKPKAKPAVRRAPELPVEPRHRIKRVVQASGTKRVKSVKPFDRNRDGATEGELQRAAHLITNVTEVSREQRNAYNKSLQQLTRDLTDFLVVEIAPYESAIDAALDDAGDSVRIITGVQHASFSMGRADALLRRLPELKTLDWVCNRLAIPEDIRTLVINEYMGTNEKTSGNSNQHFKQLLELLKSNGMSRPQEGPRSRMPQSQARAVSRSTVAARSRKD